MKPAVTTPQNVNSQAQAQYGAQAPQAGISNDFSQMTNNIGKNIPSILNNITAPQTQTPTQPSSPTGLKWWEQQGANLLPTAGAIGGGIAGGAADLLGGGIPGAVVGTGVGASIGQGLKSYVDQYVLGTTKKQSLLSNVGKAATTGAEFAPFGIVGGAEGAMAASDSAATSTFTKLAPTFLKGTAAGLTSSVLTHAFDNKLNAKAMPSIISDGIVSGTLMTALPALSETFKGLLGGTTTVQDLTNNADAIIKGQNQAVNDIISHAETAVGKGGTVDLLNSEGPTTIGPTGVTSPLTGGNNIFDNALSNEIANTKNAVFGDNVSPTLEKYNLLSSKGVTPNNPQTGEIGGLQETLNNINTPDENGQTILGKQAEIKQNALKNVSVTPLEASNAITSPVDALNNKLLANPNIGQNETLKSGFGLNNLEIKPLNGLDNATKLAYVDRLMKGIFPSLDAQNATLLTQIIAHPDSIGNISGADLEALNSNIKDIAYSKITANSPVTIARQSLASDLSSSIDKTLQANMTDAESTAYKQANKDIVDIVNAKNNIEPLVRQNSIQGQADNTNFYNTHSNESILARAQASSENTIMRQQTTDFVNQVKQLAANDPTGWRKSVAKIIALPIGIAKGISSSIISKIGVDSVIPTAATGAIDSNLSSALSSNVDNNVLNQLRTSDIMKSGLPNSITNASEGSGGFMGILAKAKAMSNSTSGG